MIDKVPAILFRERIGVAEILYHTGFFATPYTAYKTLLLSFLDTTVAIYYNTVLVVERRRIATSDEGISTIRVLAINPYTREIDVLCDTYQQLKRKHSRATVFVFDDYYPYIATGDPYAIYRVVPGAIAELYHSGGEAGDIWDMAWFNNKIYTATAPFQTSAKILKRDASLGTWDVVHDLGVGNHVTAMAPLYDKLLLFTFKFPDYSNPAIYVLDTSENVEKLADLPGSHVHGTCAVSVPSWHKVFFVLAPNNDLYVYDDKTGDIKKVVDGTVYMVAVHPLETVVVIQRGRYLYTLNEKLQVRKVLGLPEILAKYPWHPHFGRGAFIDETSLVFTTRHAVWKVKLPYEVVL